MSIEASQCVCVYVYVCVCVRVCVRVRYFTITQPTLLGLNGEMLCEAYLCGLSIVSKTGDLDVYLKTKIGWGCSPYMKIINIM